jgi:hypothetical protein
MSADPAPVWAVLATDGRHCLLGRHRAPSEDELARAGEAIGVQGVRAWLVLLHGDRWVVLPPEVLRLRPLHEGLDDADFAQALEAFVRLHRARM